MSIKDRDRQAAELFGPTASVSDAGVLRIGTEEYQLPRATDTAMALALFYAREHGPAALRDPIGVCRHPGDNAYMSVPFHALHDFHLRSISGGVARPTGRAFLYARMSCTEIPADARFGHSCIHGEGPHEILVCITQTANAAALYKCLRDFSERREELKSEVYRRR
jgi:hypothetical protein